MGHRTVVLDQCRNPQIHLEAEQILRHQWSAMMNRFQVQATTAYADGAYAPLANSETWLSDVEDLGDGLFKYLIVELSTRENCETWTDAIERIDRAIQELERVSTALRLAYLDEKPSAQKYQIRRLRDLDH
jgi:hypothetical protein